MRHGQAGHGALPPAERIDVLSLATRPPADHPNPATRWSVDDMTAVLRDHARRQAMSRSTLWRVLDEADLKPPRCVYWLKSHAPAFDAKARDSCASIRRRWPHRASLRHGNRRTSATGDGS